MIRVSSVSYTNSIPYIFGLQRDLNAKQIKLSLDIPSICAEKLIRDEVDLGLVPVASIPQIPNAEIVSNYCIGALKSVNTVMLLSEVPLEEIEAIWLDFQSKTSVNLVQVLCREWWKIKPKFLLAKPGYEAEIKNRKAGVVIGDRCFFLNEKFRYRYDLAEAWHQLTGLPFVFACWVANKSISVEFLAVFNESLQFGLQHKEEALVALLNPKVSVEVAREYLTKVISYELDAPKKAAMTLFLEKIKQNSSSILQS